MPEPTPQPTKEDLRPDPPDPPDPWIAALIAACLGLFTLIVWATLHHPRP